MMISLRTILALTVLPLSAAFVSQSKNSASLLKNTVTPSSTTELGMAWHDYVRNDPYNKNRNGEVSILKNDYYYNRDRLGNVQQPYSYDRYSWSDNNYRNNGYRSNDYYGPFANSDSARRYGYGNNNYAYGYNSMRDGYSSRVNNGRFPPEDNYSRTYGYNDYSSSRYGYNNYNNNYSRYGYNNDYGYNQRRGYDNYRQGPWLNSGRFPDENGSGRYGYNDYDYGYNGRSSYGYSNNGYNSRYGADSYGYSGRSGYGRNTW